ncbi:hypothetical protein KC960_00665 [Candidatus Saccharibacteria bacterium]|nr:hypothetical protein [Candidatus Saccharibacteria bacterium]
MARRIFSHVLITLAVFFLIATFFTFLVDNVLLNTDKLTSALKNSGVNTEITNILPDIATKDAPIEELENMKQQIIRIVDQDFVTTKVTNLTSSLSEFLKKGTPEPTIDLSDFPQKLQAAGIEVDQKMIDDFTKPIEINEDGQLDKLHDFYETFTKIKIAGVIICILLLIGEWFVAEKGKKLQRIGRIFLHTSIWLFFFWVITVFLPVTFTNKLNSPKEGDIDTTELIKSAVKAIQNLISPYMLGTAIVFGVIAAVLYILRKYIPKNKQGASQSPKPQSASKA